MKTKSDSDMRILLYIFMEMYKNYLMLSTPYFELWRFLFHGYISSFTYMRTELLNLYPDYAILNLEVSGFILTSSICFIQVHGFKSNSLFPWKSWKNHFQNTFFMGRSALMHFNEQCA